MSTFKSIIHQTILITEYQIIQICNPLTCQRLQVKFCLLIFYGALKFFKHQ